MALRRLPDEALFAAIITALRADATVVATATRGSFTEVPQGTSAPYNKVQAPTASRTDTCGRWGASTVIDVDSVSAGDTQAPGLRMRAAVMSALHAQTLAMTGHTMLGVQWETSEYFPEVVNGLKYHHHVATFRVWTEQSST